MFTARTGHGRGRAEKLARSRVARTQDPLEPELVLFVFSFCFFSNCG